MGKYQAYPAYKDSGVEWMGNIPSSWLISKTRRFYQIGMGQTILKEDLEEDGVWPVFSATEGNHYLGRISNPVVRLDSGDLVIPARGNSIGSVKLVMEKATTTQTTIFCKLQNRSFLFSKYVHYYFVGHRNDLFRFTQTAIPQITTEEVGGNPLIIPSLVEQQKIAAFLDHETEKIDALIEKQQQLIQLLKEKRQAVISHAVTKGLNPNAPMKDSGIEWLGEVPAHWEVMQLRRVIGSMEQGKSPECESRPAEANEWGVLKTSCVNHAEFRSEENKYLPSDVVPFSQFEVKAGDVLMSRASGSIDLIGSVAYVYETRPKILLSDKIFRLILSDRINGIFFKYLMQSSYMRSNISVAISGAEGMANNITKSSIMAFAFALPSVQEQYAIVNYLGEAISRFTSLLVKAETMISLLQERRTALISAAVTGKIDVRNFVEPATR